MDPLTALGVAGACIQFVDFAQRLVAKTAQLYRSADGAARDRRALEAVLRDFALLQPRVLPRDDDDGSLVRGAAGGGGGVLEVELNAKGAVCVDKAIQRLVSHWLVLKVDGARDTTVKGGIQAVAQECSKLAAVLLEDVERLKAKGQRRAWKSLKTALADLWKETELVEFQRKLGIFKSQTEWHAVVALRECVDLVPQRQEDQFSSLQRTMQHTVELLLQQGQIDTVTTELSESLDSDTLTEISLRQQRIRVGLDIAIHDALSSRGLGDISLATLVDPSVTAAAAELYSRRLRIEEWEVLESLQFQIMTNREDSIADSDLATFDCIYREPRSTDQPWDNFSDWLRRGDSLYWLTGKAGSGKSTLMKYLFGQFQTMDALRIWSIGAPLVVAGFFFWNSGSHLQKTHDGLIRSLLYQSLAAHRELIPIVFPDLARTRPGDLGNVWTSSRLKASFARLLKQDKVPLNICFFIDGLDEYNGDHAAMVELLKDIVRNPNVKACVSSRPLPAFESAFNGYSGLMLHNLTFQAIQTFVKNKLSDHPIMIELEKDDPELTSRLALEISRRASGVFLWVKLVVRLLLDGLTNSDRPADLEHRLKEVPDDLEGLYWHLLQAVEPPFYLGQASRLLLIADQARKPLTPLVLAYSDMEQPDFAVKVKIGELSEQQRSQLSESIEERLRSQCRGLLEVPSSSDTTIPAEERVVQFMHQSVAEFLQKSDVKARLNESLKGQAFNPNVALMKACLLELKHLEYVFYPGRQPGILLAGMWFGSAMSLIARFVDYARRAETELEEPQIPLVAELDRVAQHLCNLYIEAEARFDAGLISRNLHWSERTHEGRIIDPCQENGSILSFAVKAGLAQFVLALLRRDTKRPTTTTKALKPSNSQIKYALLLHDVMAADPKWRANPAHATIGAALLSARSGALSSISLISPALRGISGVGGAFGTRLSERLTKTARRRKSAIMEAHVPLAQKNGAAVVYADHGAEFYHTGTGFERFEGFGMPVRASTFGVDAQREAGPVRRSRARPPAPRVTLSMASDD